MKSWPTHRRYTAGLATVSALAIVVMAGCKVDQQKEVATYRNVLDQSAATMPYDEQAPLSLVMAMVLANANNERLASSGEDYLQAIIDKNRAVAAFLPTLSFQPSYTIEETPSGSVGGVAIPGSGGGVTGAAGFRRLNGNSLQRFEAPVVGSINVFRGGADVANVRGAEANIEARRQLLLDVQAATMLSTAETFYAVLRAERSVAVLTNSLDLQQARLRDVESQFGNGLATKLAVAQSRAQADATKALLAQAEGDVANARTALAFIVGVPQIKSALADNYRTPTTLPTSADEEAEAERSRFDIAAAIASREASRAAVQAAVAQYYPSVTLNVSGFLYREFYDDSSRWDAILSANLPIFSAGLIEADVRTAWSRLRQAALNESYVRRQALSEVRQSRENFQTATRRIEALRDEVAAAEEALSQADSAFANGLGTNLDALTAQDQLLTSRLDLATAEFDQTVFYLDLLRATGGLSSASIKRTTGADTRPASSPATVAVR
jgi:outer membrane protein